MQIVTKQIGKNEAAAKQAYDAQEDPLARLSNSIQLEQNRVRNFCYFFLRPSLSLHPWPPTTNSVCVVEPENGAIPKVR